METFDIGERDQIEINLQPGVTFYLIEIGHVHEGGWFYRLQAIPGRTNMSDQECVNGFLGAYNDVSSEAQGFWRIDQVDGTRITATRLE